ncbi:MAG TPA: hypothetical protein VLC48_06205, partial [Gemmatimonadota bacterium]|nr:hypothetical protein [Gemmatimonadota bacterium]
WGEARGWKPYYLDLRNDLPHFDAFRTRLRHCGEGVSRSEFVCDVRAWRARARECVSTPVRQYVSGRPPLDDD